MDFSFLPPEITSGLIYSGPGEGPLLAASASWAALTQEIEASAQEIQSIVSATEISWRGPSAVSMAQNVSQHVSWLHQTAGYAASMATHAQGAAGLFSTVHASVVPPPVILANRTLQAFLVATNILGQNAATIAANEAHYMMMWAQDAASMASYSAGSSALTSSMQPLLPPTGVANPAAVSPQSVGLAGNSLLSWLSNNPLGQLVGTLLGTQGQPVTSWPQLLTGWLDSSTGLGANADLWNTIFSSGFFMPAQYAMGDIVAMASMSAAYQAHDPTNTDPDLGVARVPVMDNRLYVPEPPHVPTASMGSAPSVGGGSTRLSVPPSWTNAGPTQGQSLAPALSYGSALTEAEVGEVMATEGAFSGGSMGMIPMPMGMAATSTSSTNHAGGEKKRQRWSEYDDLEYGDNPGSVIPKNPWAG